MNFVTWQINLASTRARGTRKMLPFQRILRVWNFPLQVGAQIPRENGKFGEWVELWGCGTHILDVAIYQAYTQLIPTN